MFIQAVLRILSKKEKPFTAKDGSLRTTYSLNYSQLDDEIVGTISVSENIFNSCEKGKIYELTGEYRSSSNGNFISWQSAKVLNEGGKL